MLQFPEFIMLLMFLLAVIYTVLWLFCIPFRKLWMNKEEREEFEGIRENEVEYEETETNELTELQKMIEKWEQEKEKLAEQGKQSMRKYDEEQKERSPRPDSRYQSHHDSIMEAGKAGEERICRFLQQLSFKNTVINDKNISNINSEKDAQIDHFVVSEKGIVMIETKNYGGEVDMTDRNQWIQIKSNGERKACFNAYNQSFTHKKIMEKLMKRYDFDDIPLYAIVVFANEKTIYHGLENYEGEVMKFDAMNYFLERLPSCEAMQDEDRYKEAVRWINSFQDANSYIEVDIKNSSGHKKISEEEEDLDWGYI